MTHRVDRPSVIARRRLAIGIDQVALASLANLSPRTVSKIEVGRRPASNGEMERINLVLSTLERTAQEIRARVQLLATA